MTMKKALTIAGSDTSGGAGIQADLKTMEELGVYGMTALTVIVAQDPHNAWNHEVFPIDTTLIEKQIETVLAGIGVDAVKTGMLPTPEIIELAARKIKEYGIQNAVVDPVMACKGADEILDPNVAVAMRQHLVPVAKIITPNLFEARMLAGLDKTPATMDEIKEAARLIHELGAEIVIVKVGGKLGFDTAFDVLYDGNEFRLLESEKIEPAFTHGGGCTFSSAIAASLANGHTVEEAIEIGKEFITEAVRHSFRLNQYVGPTNHTGYRKKVATQS